MKWNENPALVGLLGMSMIIFGSFTVYMAVSVIDPTSALWAATAVAFMCFIETIISIRKSFEKNFE